MFFLRQQLLLAILLVLTPTSCILKAHDSFSLETSQEREQFEQFAQSFIRYYEFNPEGRFTHEYHPFLLEKTAQSLSALEQRLKAEDFSLKGRMIIVGYEENAVPSYYTDYRQSRINDEAIVRNSVGWSLRLHNRFGFMTGFLFKDFNRLAHHFFPNHDHVFEHIDAEQIGIFDDRAHVFHEHAFGQAYPLVQRAQASVMKKYKDRKFLEIFSDLVKFWQIMYDDALKVGNKQVGATQDILFSIAYAKHLLSSNLPFYSYFTGPDITYPIEITCKHDKYVSRHAQTFVHRLFEKLKPVEDKQTVYVFCSFVDGVGKSTTLGNIKNAMKHGNDVDHFEHVDNSSSQLAEVFQCKDKVFIADLPAQMSHFTYKPDGLVYVDARTEFEQDYVFDVIDHFRKNKKEYVSTYYELLKEVTTVWQEQGLCAPCFHDQENPEYAFIKNVLLLKRESKKWIPFSHEGKHFIIRDVVPTELRVLVPLGSVKSEGLKNIEAEQMLFFQGIRLPLPYEHFLQDLVEKLKQEKIENIVFVDFMSMYPRSSRENVRINYLLQQMAHLNKQFDPNYSLYKDFVSCGELLSYLLQPQACNKILQSFEYEVLVRFALYRLIVERQDGGIEGLTVPILTDLVRKKIEQLGASSLLPLRDRASQKIEHEKKNMEKIFGMTKDFINVQSFSFQKAAALSEQLQEIFSTVICNEKINTLWQDDGKKINAGNNNLAEGPLDVIMRTVDGKKFRVLYKFGPECRFEQLLTPFFRDIRVFWYAALCNLLDTQKQLDGHFALKADVVPVPPAFIKAGTDGNFYAVQPYFESWVGDVAALPKIPYDLFNLPPTPRLRFGQSDEAIYRLDWKADATNKGLFEFGSDLSKIKKRGFYVPAMFMVAQRYQNEHGANMVIPASKLLQNLKKSAYWKSVYQGWVTEAEKNSRIGQARQSRNELENSWFARFTNAMPQQNNAQPIKRPIYLGTMEQRSAIKLFVRMLATLEMVIKDPDANIVVRFGNRKDFKAAIRLYERVVLPYFFGILFKEPLFKDYNKLEPYPSWDFWDEFSDA